MKSMRRIFFFSVRCAKEIVRDPINLGFGLGFPFVLLLLLSGIASIVTRQVVHPVLATLLRQLPWLQCPDRSSEMQVQTRRAVQCSQRHLS